MLAQRKGVRLTRREKGLGTLPTNNHYKIKSLLREKREKMTNLSSAVTSTPSSTVRDEHQNRM